MKFIEVKNKHGVPFIMSLDIVETIIPFREYNDEDSEVTINYKKCVVNFKDGTESILEENYFNVVNEFYGDNLLINAATYNEAECPTTQPITLEKEDDENDTEQ